MSTALPWPSCVAFSLPASCATSVSRSLPSPLLSLSTQANQCRHVCHKPTVMLYVQEPCTNSMSVYLHLASLCHVSPSPTLQQCYACCQQTISDVLADSIHDYRQVLDIWLVTILWLVHLTCIVVWLHIELHGSTQPSPRIAQAE